MSEVIISGPVAYLSGSSSAVYFSKSSHSFSGDIVNSGTNVPMRKFLTLNNVVPWGEDNLFPQHINHEVSNCGIMPSILNFKAKCLFGGGIIPGIIDDVDAKGNEIFKPFSPKSNDGKKIWAVVRQPWMMRFYAEFLNDWTFFANCFPEIIFSKDGKSIAKFVHQESCDVRYKVMNNQGVIDTVYLSKYWGSTDAQLPKFDKRHKNKWIIEDAYKDPMLTGDDGSGFVKALPAIDMYDALNSAISIAAKLKNNRYKSAILPVNYPSPDKPYYQIPYWDGARVAGWLEIVAKVPAIIKAMYNRAMRIRYHIEIPDTYWSRKFGDLKWNSMTIDEQLGAKKQELRDMDDFLSNPDNNYNSFVSEFCVDKTTGKDVAHIIINTIEDNVSSQKDLVASSSGNVELLMATQTHPAIFSAGMTGDAYRSGGGSGSDIREAYTVQQANMFLERQIILEPLNLMRDYNREVGGKKEWREDLVFRFKDTVLTTLDKDKSGQTSTINNPQTQENAVSK